MQAREGQIVSGERHEMTDAERAARGRRNAAIGFSLFALVVIFYVATFVKMQPGDAPNPPATEIQQ